jgi:Leucine-rich repeat (LRR) protein
MRNIIFTVLLCLPMIGYAQKTYIPDNAFEQALINLDLDDVFDDSVYTSAIDTVKVMYLSYEGITDLTGIEDFFLLSELFCNDNQIINLDLSNNTNLVELNCNDNLLVSLDVRNGNNLALWYFTAINNFQLYCIAVNDIAYANYNWLKDSGCVFSSNCGTSSVEDHQSKRKLIKILDVLGRSVTPKPNIPLMYIYDDGSVEKRIMLD